MSRARIPSLDGVRAISILLVIAGHWTETHSAGAAADIAGAFANLGVRIFFVLSGYLITWLLLEERANTGSISLRDFYARRARRILPASMFFMLAAFLVYHRELRWPHAVAALLYVTNFDPGHPWFLGHLWSLSVEEQFYMLWPAALRKWQAHRATILGIVIAIAPLYRVACHVAGWHGRADETFPAVADILAVGCLTAILSSQLPVLSKPHITPDSTPHIIPNSQPHVTPNAREARVRNLLLRLTSNAWLALAMLAAVVAVPIYAGALRFHLTPLLLFVGWPLLHASIAGLLLHVIRRPYGLLNARPMVWLGKISYSLYLWQQLFAFGPHPRPIWWLGLALTMASVSYYVVERPMLGISFAPERRPEERLGLRPGWFRGRSFTPPEKRLRSG
jgi:peptidoglycan/LPS O-acetylase OafA/YrhL